MPETEEKTAEAEAPASRKILLIAAAIGGFMFLAVLVLTYRYKAQREAELLAAAEAAKARQRVIYVEDADNVLTGAMLRLAPMTLNLSSDNTFLQLAVVVEYFELHLPPDVKRHQTKLRDTVIQVVTGKTGEELLSVDGKSQLRLELLHAMNRSLAADDNGAAQDAIVDVYFSEFTVRGG